MEQSFSATCRLCPRLANFLGDVKAQNPDYYAKPVPPFGDADPRLLIVGLAPGMHGANRTGRPFTGDYAGILLYRTLHKFGYGSQPESISADDPLRLTGCRITNAVKCLPPQNKPDTQEIKLCNSYLKNELEGLKKGTVVLALGNIAHQAVLSALGQKKKDYPFAHGAAYDLPTGHKFVSSYHCSRYNTQTKRLTETMFEDVFNTIANQLC